MMGCQGIMWRKMISSCVGLARCVWLHAGQNASSNVCAIMAGTSVWGVEKCRVRHYPTYQRSQKNALGEKISRYYSSSHMTLHHIEVVSLKSNLSVASVVSAKSFETGSRYRR